MVHFRATVLLTAVPLVAAYPWAMELNEQLQKRTEPAPRDPVFLSGRPNTAEPPAGFDASEQFVNVTEGSGHEFVSPGSSDLRGQCPGLNAAANHGFLPHSGIASSAQTITGLGDAYNMAPELALVLATLAIALGGDVIAGTWSIGGAYSTAVPLFPAGGLVSTHNKYENDASVARGDAYLNGGNVGVFEMRSWDNLYEIAEEYTLDDLAKHSDYVTRWSELNNPYYFSGPFSGLVAPAAHDFIVNFMSNHSAENPGGTLTREVLKSFFAITGDAAGSFVHNPGQERIPENWYKRPAANAYNVVNVVADVLVNNAMYPGSFRIGGNTGTVNSFVGVDVGNLTGDVFNLATLGDGNNAACFLLQASLAVLPSATLPLLGAVGSILNWATEQIAPVSSLLGCPQLASFNNTLFNQFPGASYKAQGE